MSTESALIPGKWMKYCVVPLCRNTCHTVPNKKFFSVPKIEKTRKMWLMAMNRDETRKSSNVKLSSISTLYVCEDHFNLEQDLDNYYEYKLMNARPRLKKGIFPHLFNCQKTGSTSATTIEVKDDLKRQRQQLVEDIIKEYEGLQNVEAASCSATSDSQPMDVEESHPEETASTSKNTLVSKVYHESVQVNMRPHYRSKGVNTKISVINRATSPVKILTTDSSVSPIKIPPQSKQLHLPASISEGSYSSSQTDDPVFLMQSASNSSEENFETELKTESLSKDVRQLLMTVIEKNPKLFLGLPVESYHLIRILTSKAQTSTMNILVTLKKIRLNDSYVVLGVHFGMSAANISRIFKKTLIKIATLMQELILWPPAERLRYHLPIPFRARYYKVVSIIDCLEVQIEKPSDPVNQALTWSSYKHANTIKYLISCTPDGLVNYISPGYGGRATDTAIVEDCGYLAKLLPGSFVMADRGFKNIAMLLQQMRCTLVRPPSVSSNVQCTEEEVKESKRIAALRIHVERVIGRLREFNMLQPHACIDHNLVQYLDYIIIIACGVINLQDHIIKVQI